MELTKIRGINEKRSAELNKIGIFETADLMRFFPKNYLDLREKRMLNYAYHNDIVLTSAKVITVPPIRYTKYGSGTVRAVCEQDGLTFTIVWFNQPYVISKLKEGEEYLFALMEHFKNTDTVGFCWDSGHEMCYNHSQDLLSKLGDRLIMTHINDNLGISRFDGKTFWTDDLHLLPFDGIADWDYNVDRLKKSRPLEILNFELNIKSKPNRHENDIYAQMDIEQYFTEAYKRACKIAYKYSK